MADADRETVRRVQAGETEAFESLVERYKQRTFRLAFQVLRDQEEALDVSQEAFVKAYRSLGKFKGDSAFYTWLFRITMNLALDRRRQRATRIRVMGGEDVPPEDWERTAASEDRGPDEEALGAQRRARIAGALETLSENHRAILVLSDIEGLSYREIAEVLSVPMGTVMSRLHNARKRLREALGPGVLGLVLAVALGALPLAAGAQAPPPAAAPAAGWTVPQVCVYAVVLLASSQPGGPPGSRLTPTPPLRPPREGPSSAPEGAAPSEDAWDAPPAGSGRCGGQPRLRLWVPRLHEVFGYSVYEALSAFETMMPLGSTQRFALPGGRELDIQPLAIRPPVVRIAVKILRGPIAEVATILAAPPRRPALIGGPPHGPGVLIIAIRSRVE